MTIVSTSSTVSLDGFIAGPDESGFDQLFQWLGSGDVVVPAADREFHLTAASAKHWTGLLDATGVCVVGRRLFDLTNGWNGNPPVGKPHVVLSHRPAPDGFDPVVPFTFTEGIEEAIGLAREIAGDKDIALNGGKVASQALAAGLLDEIWFNVVPVLLGRGVRYLDEFDGGPIVLGDPVEVIEGKRVTHLRYRVNK